jgi:hypothetical protein
VTSVSFFIYKGGKDSILGVYFYVLSIFLVYCPCFLILFAEGFFFYYHFLNLYWGIYNWGAQRLGGLVCCLHFWGEKKSIIQRLHGMGQKYYLGMSDYVLTFQECSLRLFRLHCLLIDTSAQMKSFIT